MCAGDMKMTAWCWWRPSCRPIIPSLSPSPPPNHIWPGPPWSDSHIPSTRPGLAGIASLHEIFLPKKAPICNIYLPKTLNLCFKVSIQSFWRINCGFCQVLGRVVSPGRRIISGEAGQEHHICLRGGGYRGLCPALFSLSLARILSPYCSNTQLLTP